MADFVLVRGADRSLTFALLDSAGAAFNLTGYSVTIAVNGRAVHTTKAGSINSPATLGTGAFAFAAADFTTLKPTLLFDPRSSTTTKRIGDPYSFTIWAHNGALNIPMLVGSFDVVDVPQRP